jgi:UDP-N-acetylglucosamine:LPS N-acetylglucosamine transferase
MDMEGRTLFVSHSERDWRIVLNLWEAYKILRERKPTVILSTGAGIVVPFAIVARILFAARIVYIETITRVSRPSLTGRLMYWLADHFFYQWEALRPFFPNGHYLGRLI